MWTEERDEALISLVGAYKGLYVPEHPAYKDMAMRRNSWQEIAEKMNMNFATCKKRWLCLRDRYVRNRRQKQMAPQSGAGSGDCATVKWVLFPKLDAMLHKTVKHRSGGDIFEEFHASTATTSINLDAADATDNLDLDRVSMEEFCASPSSTSSDYDVFTEPGILEVPILDTPARPSINVSSPSECRRLPEATAGPSTKRKTMHRTPEHTSKKVRLQESLLSLMLAQVAGIKEKANLVFQQESKEQVKKTEAQVCGEYVTAVLDGIQDVVQRREKICEVIKFMHSLA